MKEYTPNWSEEVFAISKIKNAVPWTYVIMDLNGEKNIETFYEKELQKKNQSKLKQNKSLKEKEIDHMSNGKAMIIHLTDGLIKKILYKNESIVS